MNGPVDVASSVSRPLSQVAFHRAQKLIPGGVNSPARAFGAVGGTPPFISNAQGAYLQDLDGNRYLDFIGSWGPMILGHAHPAVIAAASEAMARGSSYGAPCEAESELAELVIEAIPSVEMVRFVSSGTEATMSAIRLARGFTKRDLIVKFAGCYHGHADALLVAAGSSALTHGVPTSPGVPEGTTRDTVVLPYNDIEALQELFRSRGNAIAGIILEPVVGNMGLVPPSEVFRRELRRLTYDHGALLIYDEVMTGFRLAYGGSQQLLGDSPDITVLGKIIGGGFPVGAFGGRADIMKMVMPAGPVFQAGTLSGNPVAMAAGIATLKQLKRLNPYDQLERMGAKLESALKELTAQAGVASQLNRVGSMWTLFFTREPVVDLATAKTSNTAMFARFFWAMMDQGVYLPCSQFEAAFISAAMTDADIEFTITASKNALQRMLAES